MRIAAIVALVLGGAALLLTFLPRDQPAGEPVWVDPDRGTMWMVTASWEMSWGEAQEFVEELDYAGYSDWRLPTRAELETLVVRDAVETDPDSDVIPLLESFRSPGTGHMFSGTLASAGRPDQPWILNIRNGHVFNGHKYRGFVRAVRDTGPDNSR